METVRFIVFSLIFVVFEIGQSCGSIFNYKEIHTVLVNVTYVEPESGRIVERNLQEEKCWYGQNSLKDPADGTLIEVRSGLKTDGCFRFNDVMQSVQEPWVALIARGNCSFEEKVRNAIDGNATAVIIYNNRAGGPVVMHHQPLNIVTVFITYEDGMFLADLLRQDVSVSTAIRPGTYSRQMVTSYHPQQTSVLFVSISFIVLMVVSLAWLMFYYIQRFRYAHAKGRLTKRLANAARKAISKIPTKTLKPGDPELTVEFDLCAVCIEPYKPDETIRILPCNHAFHKACIDPWLTEHRNCPMCKLDILKAYGLQVNCCQEQEAVEISLFNIDSWDHSLDEGSSPVVIVQYQPAAGRRQSITPPIERIPQSSANTTNIMNNNNITNANMNSGIASSVGTSGGNGGGGGDSSSNGNGGHIVFLASRLNSHESSS